MCQVCTTLPDLLRTTKQETEIDLSKIKITAMAVVGIILSLGFAFFLRQLYQDPSGTTFNIIAVLVFATLFLVVVFLQSLLIKDIGRIGTILFLQVVAMIIPFIFLLSSFVLVGLLITFLLLFWGSVSGKNELQYSMKVRIFRLSKFVLPKAITGLSIFVAASYISVFQGQGLVVSENTFRRVVLPSESIIKVIVPGLSLEDSFATAIEKLNPNIQKFSKELKDEFVNLNKENYAKKLQYSFESSDPLIDIFYNAYTVNVGKISGNKQVLILFVLGALIFLLVRSVGTPISWFVALVAAAVYEILIALGFAVVVLETRSKEIVLLK